MKKNSGQSLFELILAIGVIALIVVTVVSTASVSLRNNSFSKNRAIATNYSQEAVEWLRGQRDSGWSLFLSNAALGSSSSANYCFNSSPPGAWPAKSASVNCLDSLIASTIYGRRVTLTCSASAQITTAIPCNGANVDTIRAMVVTTWADNVGSHSATTSTYFSNWRENGISAPIPTTPTPIPLCSCTVSFASNPSPISRFTQTSVAVNATAVTCSLTSINYSSSNGTIIGVIPLANYPPGPYNTSLVANNIGTAVISANASTSGSATCQTSMTVNVIP